MRKMYLMQASEPGFREFGFRNKGPDFTEDVLLRYNFREFTEHKGFGEPSWRHRRITWMGALLAEGSSFLARKEGFGIRDRDPFNLNWRNALPLLRAFISLILPPIASVMRKGVFWVREAREISSLNPIWAKESQYNFQAPFGGDWGIEGRRFNKPL